MPLIPCPDCQSEISDTASTCIKCGRPMEEWERNAFKAQKEELAFKKLVEEELAFKKLVEEELAEEELAVFPSSKFQQVFGNDWNEVKFFFSSMRNKIFFSSMRNKIIFSILCIAFVGAITSNSDYSSTTSSTPKATPTPTPRVYTPTPRVYTPTPTLCRKVAPSVIRTLNARARYGAQLDVNSGWAIKRTSVYSDGHFIAAKYTAPAAKKGRVDAFYADTIANPTYILPASQAATMAFPSTYSFTVKELIGDPEGFREFRDAIECAMKR